jgi:hypothetical protein
MADRVILEVNSWQPAELEGMHDIYHSSAPLPHRTPIQILAPSDRIGVPYLQCSPVAWPRASAAACGDLPGPRLGGWECGYRGPLAGAVTGAG